MERPRELWIRRTSVVSCHDTEPTWKIRGSAARIFPSNFSKTALISGTEGRTKCFLLCTSSVFSGDLSAAGSEELTTFACEIKDSRIRSISVSSACSSAISACFPSTIARRDVPSTRLVVKLSMLPSYQFSARSDCSIS